MNCVDHTVSCDNTRKQTQLIDKNRSRNGDRALNALNHWQTSQRSSRSCDPYGGHGVCVCVCVARSKSGDPCQLKSQ